jgi:hypothetical protein
MGAKFVKLDVPIGGLSWIDYEYDGRPVQALDRQALDKWADRADMERFGPAYCELEIWCRYPAWTIEEATALSLGHDPQAISLKVIECENLILHRSGLKKLNDLMRLSRIAVIYQDRHRRLLRAARYKELAATPVDGSYEVRPLDFLEWFERQKDQYPWDSLPADMTEQIRARYAGDSNGGPADTGPKEAAVANAHIPGDDAKQEVAPGAGNTKSESLGNHLCATANNVEACVAWLKIKLTEPRDPNFKSRDAYKAYAMQEFGVSWRCFNRAWDRAKKETGSKRHGRGRPAKGK